MADPQQFQIGHLPSLNVRQLQAEIADLLDEDKHMNAGQLPRNNVDRVVHLQAQLLQVKDRAIKDMIRAIEAGALGDGKHFQQNFGLAFINMLKRTVGDL